MMISLQDLVENLVENLVEDLVENLVEETDWVSRLVKGLTKHTQGTRRNLQNSTQVK